jgi:diguanylate cyclase (GGDEF)-like protein
MLVWALLGTAMSMGNNFTRPPEYFGHYITDVWLILMFYAAVPLPPRVQMPPVLIYSATSLAILFLHKRAPMPLYTYIVVLMTILSVWCGHLISARIHRYRRATLAAQVELERQARTDPLTGAINRREFTRIAEEELARHARLGKPLSVVMLDLDHFKSVNDRHGHAAGDAVLVEFTHRAQAALRGYDRLARTGGEEFCVLLPEAAGDEARAIAERIRHAVSAAPIAAAGTVISVTTSAGVATTRTSEDRIEDLLQRADTALYEAKHAGRDRVAVASG